MWRGAAACPHAYMVWARLASLQSCACSFPARAPAAVGWQHSHTAFNSIHCHQFIYCFLGTLRIGFLTLHSLPLPAPSSDSTSPTKTLMIDVAGALSCGPRALLPLSALCCLASLARRHAA
jgi:hypothetical protein